MNPKEFTRKELELALKRIQLGRQKVVSQDRKLSIAAVAEEAGVSSSLIHNSHPDFAEQIRSLTNPDSAGKESKRDSKLAEANKKIAELKELAESLELDLKKIAIQNLTLSEENKRLKASASNVHSLE